jgi:hypothetical protein
MYNTSFIKKILLVATVVLLYSCDKDFNAIGDELIGDNHFDLQADKYDVIAYNQEVTPVQSNGLPANALGIYDNPVFGTTTANIATQVGLVTYAPTIGESPVISKVVLSVPYFSHVVTNNTDGSHTYALDSIYGDPNGTLKLSVYESGVQMRNSYFSSGSQFAQLYNTDMDTGLDPDPLYINFNKSKDPDPVTGTPSGKRLNDDDSNDNAQNDKFFFDSKEIVDVTKDADGKETTTRSAPQMRLNLNKAFFQDKILNAPASKLSSADVFQEYFRGLYFRVERSGSSPSNMALIDLAKGGTPATITITYRAKTAITTDAADTTEEKTLVINLSGAAATLLNDVKKTDYANAILPANIKDKIGDDRLYLKGGQGSVALIKLFGEADFTSYNDEGVLVNTPNKIPDELDEIRNNVKTKKWLVNEANLIFYVDADKMAPVDKDEQVKRVYLYDATNNLPIVDYADGTSGSLTTADPKQTRYIFGGILKVDATTKRGISYKVNITKHMRNLVKDPTIKDVRLGLSVTESIDVFASNLLKLKNNEISQAPRGSVMGPLGTILYGGTSSASIPADKKLQLEVYYTKPN